MVTETKTATLEDVLNVGLTSGKTEEVSKDVEEAPEDKVEEAPGTEETGKEKDALTPENFDSRVQSEVDKKTNTYRERREADSAYIRSLQTKVKELSVEKSSNHLNKLMETIIEGQEEEGIEPDKIEAQRKSFKEIKELFKVYDENITKVQETIEFIDAMAEKIPNKIVGEFGLDDANPAIRASNGVKFLNETVSLFKRNQDFLLTLENFLPRGDELRTKIDDIVQGLAEFDSDKSKLLYLKDQLQGVKVNRKKPPSSSGTPGGGSWRDKSADEKIEYALAHPKK